MHMLKYMQDSEERGALGNSSDRAQRAEKKDSISDGAEHRMLRSRQHARFFIAEGIVILDFLQRSVSLSPL